MGFLDRVKIAVFFQPSFQNPANDPKKQKPAGAGFCLPKTPRLFHNQIVFHILDTLNTAGNFSCLYKALL